MRQPTYGELQFSSVAHEVKSIWRSRDDELQELPVDGISYELVDNIELVERKELASRIMADAPLTKREELVVQLRVIHELTFDEIGQSLRVTHERVRQIYIKAMRKLRTHQAKITGESAYVFGEVMTWSQWKEVLQREKNRLISHQKVEQPEQPEQPVVHTLPDHWVSFLRRLA